MAAGSASDRARARQARHSRQPCRLCLLRRGEEFGIILCLIIMAIFAFIVLRGLRTALKEHDDFTRYAVAGLVSSSASSRSSTWA
jgi:disulfide bond formation protein DsbB